MLHSPVCKERHGSGCDGGRGAGTGVDAVAAADLGCKDIYAGSGNIRLDLAIPCVTTAGVDVQAVVVGIVSADCDNIRIVRGSCQGCIRIRSEKDRARGDETLNWQPHVEGAVDIYIIVDADGPDSGSRIFKTEQNQFVSGRSFHDFIIQFNHSLFQCKADRRALVKPGGNPFDGFSQGGDDSYGVKLRPLCP